MIDAGYHHRLLDTRGSLWIMIDFWTLTAPVAWITWVVTLILVRKAARMWSCPEFIVPIYWRLGRLTSQQSEEGWMLKVKSQANQNSNKIDLFSVFSTLGIFGFQCGSWEAPYNWRHAGLSQMRDFLRAERDAGRYHPLLAEGLDD